jgi:hypothetical protein
VGRKLIADRIIQTGPVFIDCRQISVDRLEQPFDIGSGAAAAKCDGWLFGVIASAPIHGCQQSEQVQVQRLGLTLGDYAVDVEDD